MLEESSQATHESDFNQLGEKNQFDYGLLNTEAKIIARQRASEIKSLMRQGTQNIIEIGQKLIEVKEQLEHGQFEDWVKVELDWSLRSARNFMLVARQFKSANFADLNIEPSALYELAAPSVSEIVRKEMLECAGQGEKITYTKAKSVIAQHKLSKLKEAKKVTVDNSSQILERESFAESINAKPVKPQHLHSLTQTTSLSPGRQVFIKEVDVHPTRYATPPQNLVIAGDVPEVEVDQDKQEELGQLIKREQASMHVASFDLSQQEAQIEEPQLGKATEKQRSKILVQHVETVEAQVVEATEIVLQPEIELTQEKDYGEDQTEFVPIHKETAVAVSAPVNEAVDDYLENLKQEDTDKQTFLYKAYQFLIAEAFEYVKNSPNLKFLKVNEVVKEIASTTDISELFLKYPLDQVQLQELWTAIKESIPLDWVIHWILNYPQIEQQADEIWKVIAGCVSPTAIANETSENQLAMICHRIMPISQSNPTFNLENFDWQKLSNIELDQLINKATEERNLRHAKIDHKS